VPIDDKTPNWRHQLTLVDREELTIQGVISLGSYDEKEIIMETEQGMLTVRGDGLNIKQLSLDKENIIVEGSIKGLAYDEAVQAKKGLLGRLLK
jgi:sporulation protein YabP